MAPRPRLILNVGVLMMVEALRADYKVLGDYRIRERGQRMIHVEHKNTDKHMNDDNYLNISIATRSMSIRSIV